jgi:hypothetical protein
MVNCETSIVNREWSPLADDRGIGLAPRPSPLAPTFVRFTRATMLRMIGSKSGSAGLNSVPLITSGAPKTTISAPISSVWIA